MCFSLLSQRLVLLFFLLHRSLSFCFAFIKRDLNIPRNNRWWAIYYSIEENRKREQHYRGARCVDWKSTRDPAEKRSRGTTSEVPVEESTNINDKCTHTSGVFGLDRLSTRATERQTGSRERNWSVLFSFIRIFLIKYANVFFIDWRTTISFFLFSHSLSFSRFPETISSNAVCFVLCNMHARQRLVLLYRRPFLLSLPLLLHAFSLSCSVILSLFFPS